MKYLFVTGSKEAWRKQSIKSPMPIFYNLRSITELFQSNYFTIQDVDVRAIGAELSEALKVKVTYL